MIQHTSWLLLSLVAEKMRSQLTVIILQDYQLLACFTLWLGLGSYFAKPLFRSRSMDEEPTCGASWTSFLKDACFGACLLPAVFLSVTKYFIYNGYSNLASHWDSMREVYRSLHIHMVLDHKESFLFAR